MTEAVMVMNNHSNNNNDNWLTPPEYVESARRVLGTIDVDPASNDIAQQYIQAGTYFTIENTGLGDDVPWVGNVWMNPPYSRIIKEFVHKLCHQWDIGNIHNAIVLTNNGTDTQWCHALFEKCSAVCLPKGRIGFMNERGERITNNNKGQIFFYLGDDQEAFLREFQQYGKVFGVY